MASRLVSTPSCGLTMLRAPEDTFDYVLHVTSDDAHFVRIHCHKAVLRCHSPLFSDLTTGANFWQLEVKLAPGFLGAFVELVQYMYLRDITLISNKDKVLTLCAKFDMPLDVFLLRTGTVAPINTYRSLAFTLRSDKGEDISCITAMDFLRHVEIHHARLEALASEPAAAPPPPPLPAPMPMPVPTSEGARTNVPKVPENTPVPPPPAVPVRPRRATPSLKRSPRLESHNKRPRRHRN